MCHFYYFPINLKIVFIIQSPSGPTSSEYLYVLFAQLNVKLFQHLPKLLYLLNLFLLPPTSKMCFYVFTCTDISGHIFLIKIVYLDIYSIKLLFLHVIAGLIIDVFAFTFIKITLLTKNLLTKVHMVKISKQSKHKSS